MADEVWDALFMHVERHKKIGEDFDGDFDDVVSNESAEAHEEVVNEVLDAERRVERRMVSSDMFRRKGA